MEQFKQIHVIVISLQVQQRATYKLKNWILPLVPNYYYYYYTHTHTHTHDASGTCTHACTYTHALILTHTCTAPYHPDPHSPLLTYTLKTTQALPHHHTCTNMG